MAWVALILAGIFEVVGVIGINLVAKHNKIQSYMVLILGFLVSFSLLRDRKSTRLNSSHSAKSRMPSSA